MQRHTRTLILLGSLALLLCSFAAVLSRANSPKAGASGYSVVKTIPIPGDDGWDYLAVDSTARRVYVSHGTHVVVLDADTNAVVGKYS